jgi:WD40 repeat protein
MATPRQGATVTRLPNGKILVTGGKHHNLGTYPNAVNTAEVYDPATGAWSATANNMNFRRRWHTATLLPRTGGVLICGGYHGDGPPSEDNTCQIYDPSTNSFTSVMTMSSSRASHTATLLHDGRVLIAGGFTGATILNTAEIFDPSTGTITLLPATMTAPRLNHTATLLGNAMVLIAGGTNSGGQLASAEFFNYSTNTFGVVASMNVARERHTATPLPTGDILLAGGYNSTNLSLSSAEVYSMASGSFIPKTMTTSRDRHTATLLPTGKVLLAGTDTVGCEVYDAFAGTFSSTAAIDTVRSDAMAVLLPNGRVLVAGGQNGGAVLSSAVLYNPGP